MIVERFIFPVKAGCLGEVMALCRKYIPYFTERNVKIRCYTPMYGPRHVIAIEYEYESLEAIEKFGEWWYGSKEFDELSSQWLPLTERGGSSELWEIFRE